MMNDLGWLLVGAGVRATGLAALGLLALTVVRRSGPAAVATTGLTTLVVMVGVSILAATPWPGWSIPAGLVPTFRPAPSPDAAGPVAADLPAGMDRPAELARPSDVAPSAWDGFAEAFRREVVRPPSGPGPVSGWRWPAWVACTFLVGTTLASFRLALGLAAVRALRRSGRPIVEPELIGLMTDLGGRLGLSAAVEARETGLVVTPATVGWRRPVVLLPNHWRDWTDDERRAVLAHELAHIRRGDYLAGLLAQVSLSIHFYHPLAHALIRRLHLHQELAADAWGASLAGGRRLYLRTLAHLALSQDVRPEAWPARAFLPTRGTFLRRIEMLRDPKLLDHPPLATRGRAVTVAALVAAGLLLAGLRAPGTADRAEAQAPATAAPPATAPGAIDPLTLGSDVQMVVDFRPLDLLKNPDFRKLADGVPADSKEFKAIASGQIEQVLILGMSGPQEAAGRPKDLVFLVRTVAPYDWTKFITSKVAEVKLDGVTYLKAVNPTATCYRILDPRTLFIAPEAEVVTSPLVAGRPAARHDWDDAWKRLAPGTLRGAGNTAWVNSLLGPAQQRAAAQFQIIAPLLEQTRAVAVNLTAANGLSLDALSISAGPDDAKRVAATLQALITLGQNAMPTLKAMAQHGPPEAGRTLVDAAEAAGKMLAFVKIEQEGSVTRLKAQVDSVAPITALLAPATMASREAAKRSQSVNNLKQIGLGMHNWASAQEGGPRFPPAVLYGPDGKTPYSWRVALLPFMDQQALYNEYKFDEPWDGPNNRKLIERMPAVFHDPSDDEAKPGHASYFAPTGPMTAFPHRPEGMKFMEMLDGTSNTILVVEARRPIAWTEPEDVVILPDGPLPVFGENHPGGFNALFADGAVRFLKHTINPITLRALFTPAGGEVINANGF